MVDRVVAQPVTTELYSPYPPFRTEDSHQACTPPPWRHSFGMKFFAALHTMKCRDREADLDHRRTEEVCIK
jgi:hypothetical protein